MLPLPAVVTQEDADKQHGARTDSSWLASAADRPVVVLAAMMLLMPALGVPSELMLQDTLKSAIAAFGVLIATLVFFWQQRHQTEPLLWHGILWLPITLMLYALGSMVWSHTYLAGVEAIRWFVLSLLMWLGLNTFTRRNLLLLFWGIHGGAVVASLWVALQFWFDLDLFPQAAPPSSTFINRNFFAEYLVTTLPFSVYLLINFKNSRWLSVVTLSLALNVIALLMTGTRSALVALLVLAPVFLVILLRYRHTLAFLRWSRANKVMVCLVLITAILGLGSVPTGNEKIRQEAKGTTALQRSFKRAISMTEHQEYTERSFSIRSQMWMATARMMMANPWTGVGAGAWEVQIPLYQRNYTVLETDYYAHNEFLQLPSEYGLPVGGLFLAVLFAYLMQAAGKTWQQKGLHQHESSLRAIDLASLLALLIVSNAGYPWHLATTGILLSLGLAILAASDAKLGIREALLAKRLNWNPRFSLLFLGLIAACLLLAGRITQQAAQAESKLIRAILLADSLRKPQRSGTATFEDRKAEALQNAREGITINPHYRKLTAEIAEPFAAGGDWSNAVWILASVAASRPHVYAIWSGLANGYSQLEMHDQAQLAFSQVKRLKPATISTRTLEILLIARRGDVKTATQMLNISFDQGQFDYDMVQAGYAIGYQAGQWPLVIRSLKLRIETWPETAPDAYFRLGKVYAEPTVHDDVKAIEAFKQGLNAVPPNEKGNFRQQVPEKYRSQI